MKKIILGIMVLLGVTALAGIYKFVYLAHQPGYDVDGNKIVINTDYYQKLKNRCNLETMESAKKACLVSVKHMEANGFKEAVNGCEKGYAKNMNNCIGSLAWCEKIEEEPKKKLETLPNATIVYSSSPTLNKEFNLTIEEADDDMIQQKTSNNQYTWSVISQPDGADLVLTPSADGKTVTCTPTVAGKYVLEVIDDNESKEVEFFVNKDYSIDATKIEGYDGTSDLSMVEGMVKNQIWVYSNTLNEQQIKNIILKYLIFRIIGFDEVQGLLIEFDEIDSSLQVNIEKLKLESGIDSLDYRYYEGNDIIKQTEKISNDGSF